MTGPKVSQRPPDLSRGACVDEDPDLFHPVGVMEKAQTQAEEAKGVCRRCPVLADCLPWAIETNASGIWGATDDDERETLRRQARRKRYNKRKVSA